MTFDEIIKTLNDQKKRTRKTDVEVQKETGIHTNTIRRVLRGENCKLYSLLDVLDGFGLELSVKEKGAKEC